MPLECSETLRERENRKRKVLMSSWPALVQPLKPDGFPMPYPLLLFPPASVYPSPYKH